MLVRRLAPVLVCSLALVGCMTGQRPSLSEAPVDGPVGDPAIDAVLEFLESPPDGAAPITAGYEVLRKYGNTTTEAEVVRDGDRWSLTVGNLRYIDDGGLRSTCSLRRGRCTDGFDETRISDVLTTTGFASTAAIARVRQSALAATAPARATTQELAGTNATCAEIDVPGGTVTYCAVPQGVIALQDTADIRIELASLTSDIDPTAFDPTR